MKAVTLFALSALCAVGVQAQPKPAPISKTAIIQPTIKQSSLSAKDLADVQALLKEMNPSSFKAEIATSGKATVRLGNAAIKDLSTVSVVHAAGARPSVANEIATSVDNYVKVIWTSSVAGADRARMDRVNAILAKAP